MAPEERLILFEVTVGEITIGTPSTSTAECFRKRFRAGGSAPSKASAVTTKAFHTYRALSLKILVDFSKWSKRDLVLRGTGFSV